jgi:hypothetical protein
MAEMVSSQLLLDIYGCSQDTTRWQSALDRICHKLDVRNAVVQLFEKQADVEGHGFIRAKRGNIWPCSCPGIYAIWMG